MVLGKAWCADCTWAIRIDNNPSSLLDLVRTTAGTVRLSNNRNSTTDCVLQTDAVCAVIITHWEKYSSIIVNLCIQSDVCVYTCIMFCYRIHCVCLSACLNICLSVCMYVCMYVYPSVMTIPNGWVRSVRVAYFITDVSVYKPLSTISFWFVPKLIVYRTPCCQ